MMYIFVAKQETLKLVDFVMEFCYLLGWNKKSTLTARLSTDINKLLL